MVLWDENTQKNMNYDEASDWASKVNTDMNSHVPTRHQSITLFENVREHFDTDYCHWTSTKTKDGKAAFGQYFGSGGQSHDNLTAELRVRAVSEIPL